METGVVMHNGVALKSGGILACTGTVSTVLSDDGVANPGTSAGALTTGNFTLDANTGEPTGYLAAWQGADGVIHLITSQREYAFNLAWLKAPMPPERERR